MLWDRPVVVAGSSDEVAGHVGVGRTGWDRGSKPGSEDQERGTAVIAINSN